MRVSRGVTDCVPFCLMLLLAGCSTSGGSFVIFPNDSQLIDQAEYVASVTSPRQHTPRELQKVAIPTYFAQPGDSLLIEVTDLDADLRLPADQTVSIDGTLDLGKYGAIRVAGMSLEQIERVVHAAVQDAEPNEKIRPLNVRSISAESVVYYVLGEVNSPGSYPLMGHETALDAILTAGGLSDRAESSRIILSRPTLDGCRIVMPICYDQIVQLGDTTSNYQVMPGDRIFVTTRSMCDQLKFWRNRSLCCETPACRCPEPNYPLRGESPWIIEPNATISDRQAVIHMHDVEEHDESLLEIVTPDAR